MLESYQKLQLRPKTVTEFKDALEFILSALLEKAVDNAVRQPAVEILNIQTFI